MTSLPLVLENHLFTKVIVKANPAYQPEKDEGDLLGIRRVVHIGQNKDDPSRWRVILNLTTEAADQEKLPYKIDLECVGFFKVGPDVEEDKIAYRVRANGGAILYSSAREFLLLITGRGPWNRFYLPSTIFFDKAKREKEFEPEWLPKGAKKKRVSRVKKVLEQSEKPK